MRLTAIEDFYSSLRVLFKVKYDVVCRKLSLRTQFRGINKPNANEQLGPYCRSI